MNPELIAFLKQRQGAPRAKVLRSADQLRAGHRDMMEQLSPEQWTEYSERAICLAIEALEHGTPEQAMIAELAIIGLGYQFEAITERAKHV